jgi:hypothetical protein
MKTNMKLSNSICENFKDKPRNVSDYLRDACRVRCLQCFLRKTCEHAQPNGLPFPLLSPSGSVDLQSCYSPQMALAAKGAVFRSENGSQQDSRAVNRFQTYPSLEQGETYGGYSRSRYIEGGELWLICEESFDERRALKGRRPSLAISWLTSILADCSWRVYSQLAERALEGGCAATYRNQISSILSMKRFIWSHNSFRPESPGTSSEMW